MSQYEFKRYNYSAQILIIISKCIQLTTARGSMSPPMNNMARQPVAYELLMHNYFYATTGGRMAVSVLIYI
jgi:hypothetical protein